MPAARVAVVMFFCALLLVNASLLAPVLQNGDSAVYNDQIELGSLDFRSTHIGYFALGRVFNALLPFGTDMNMNLMVLILGVAGLSAVYAAAFFLSGSRLLAVTSSILALGMPSQVRGMLMSEVDVVSVSLIAIAYALYLHGRKVIAGLVFGLSVLVTPLSGPMVIVFILTLGVDRHGIGRVVLHHVRGVLKFGVAALLVYVPPVVAHYGDYVYGPRGVLHAPRASFTLSERVLHSWGFVWRETGWVFALYVVAAIVCLARPRLWRVGQPALALIASLVGMALVGERFVNVPVQLPNLVLLGILPAAALSVSRFPARVGPVLLLAVCLVTARTSYERVRSEIAAHERERKICVGIRELSGPLSPVLVDTAGWAGGRVFGRLCGVRGRPATVVSLRELGRSRKKWLGSSTDYTFWFFRRVGEDPIAAFLTRYSLESRTVEGRRFQVLAPRRN